MTPLDDLAKFTDGRAAATGRAYVLDHSVPYHRDCDIRCALTSCSFPDQVVAQLALRRVKRPSRATTVQFLLERTR